MSVFWDNYRITPTLLGSGATSRVHLGLAVKTNAPVAVKLFYPIHYSEHNLAMIKKEAAVLKELRKVPHVIHVVDDFLSLPDPLELCKRNVTLCDSTSMEADLPINRCHVLELVQGNNLLEVYHGIKMDLLPKDTREFVCKLLVHQVVQILAEVHSHCVAHLDVKLENVMCDIRDGELTLVDFGLSDLFDPSKPVSLKRRGGTAEYCAPEIFYTDCDYDGTKADVWSLGIMIYVLLTGKFPFDEESSDEDAICDIPQWVSGSGRELLLKILRMDPYERPTMQEIGEHEWFRSVLDRSKQQQQSVAHITRATLISLISAPISPTPK